MKPTPKIADTVLALPQQLERLTATTFDWLRTDSLAALIGAGVAVGLYLLLVTIRVAVVRWLGRDREILTWQGFVARMIGRTRSFFLALLAADVVANIVAPPGMLLDTVAFLFTIAAAIQGAIWVRELILGLVSRRAGGEADNTTLASAMGIIKVLVNVVVWSVATILVLDNLGVNVTGLVAGLGVGGIAIGLAAQGIFGDLFAALAILFDKPFRVGDQVTFGGVTGTVEAIGLKTVRIRALSGEQIVVSNSKLLEQQIGNDAQVAQRRVVLQIGVTYQTAPDLLDAIPREVEAIVAARPKCRFNRAHFVKFNDSSLDFEIVFHVIEPGYGVMMGERHAVGLALIRRFAELGIDFAYPTQVAFSAGPDGRIIDPRERVTIEDNDETAAPAPAPRPRPRAVD